MTNQQNFKIKSAAQASSKTMLVLNRAFEIPGEVYWSVLGDLGCAWWCYSRGEVFCVGRCECVWFGRSVDRYFRADGLSILDCGDVIQAMLRIEVSE